MCDAGVTFAMSWLPAYLSVYSTADMQKGRPIPNPMKRVNFQHAMLDLKLLSRYEIEYTNKDFSAAYRFAAPGSSKSDNSSIWGAAYSHLRAFNRNNRVIEVSACFPLSHTRRKIIQDLHSLRILVTPSGNPAPRNRPRRSRDESRGYLGIRSKVAFQTICRLEVFYLKVTLPRKTEMGIFGATRSRRWVRDGSIWQWGR